jgi:2-aminoadipate transaminase
MKFSTKMDRLKASAIRAVQKKIVSKEGVISFAAGLPDPDVFPIEDLRKATLNVIDNKAKVAFQYGLTKGYDPLLEKLANRMNEKESIKCSKENIVITTGSQQGLALAAMMFIDEGDIVLTESPSYLGGINACRPYGASFIGVDNDDYGMVIADLEKKLRENDNVKIIYVIPNFQNPTGKAWSLDRRKEFMEVINKYDVVVLEDNPYGEIRFKGEFVPSLKSMDTQNKVMYLGSFSKILCPGLRVGWICADKAIADYAEKLKEGLDLQCNQFTQLQVYEYMTTCNIEKHIEGIQKLYKEKCDAMMRYIKNDFPKSVKYTDPDGGMFIWLELPDEMDASLLFDKVLERGVAFIPGAPFYANDGAKNTIRLNFTVPSIEEIHKGMEIFSNLLKEVCK